MTELFDNEFLAALEGLRINIRQVAAGGRHAEQRSTDLGSGLEFRDFRPYTSGDDVRRVDWNLYRRSGRLFLRLYEEIEDMPMYILLDSSDSMYFETPARADAARRLAAALIAICVNQMDRASVFPFGGDLGMPLENLMGQTGLRRSLPHLERLSAQGPTNLVRAVERFRQRRLRPGLLVIISDFFEPRGAEALIAALQPVRHRMFFAGMTRPADTHPNVNGEVMLVDCETEAACDLTVDATTLARYRQAYDAHFGQLHRFAAGRRAHWMDFDVEQPILAQLQTMFVGGTWVVS